MKKYSIIEIPYFTHLQLKIRWYLFSNQQNYALPDWQEIHSPLLTLSVCNTLKKPEVLTQITSKKIHLTARRNCSLPLLLHPLLHCRTAENRESIQFFCQKKCYRGWGPWPKKLKLVWLPCLKASGSIPALCLEESPMNLRFTTNLAADSQSAAWMRTFFSPNGLSTLGALSTSVTNLQRNIHIPKILPC